MKVLLENPFFVLDVPWDAPRATVEREAQKLLGMLELGFAAASTYATPLGPQPRSAELVRSAVATLRDPKARVVAEFWAAHATAPTTTPANSGSMTSAHSDTSVDAGVSTAPQPTDQTATRTASRDARRPSLLQQVGWAARGGK